MQVENGKSSSSGGIVAAWAGSIALHGGVILGLSWMAPSLAPVPERRSELQVAIIESLRSTPPEIRSGVTAGAEVPRPVIAPRAPPVVVSPAREITTVPARALEAHPAPRFRKRAVHSTSERQRSVVPARPVESVEAAITMALAGSTPHTSAAVPSAVRTIASAQTRTVPAGIDGATGIGTAATTDRRGLAGSISPRLPEGESVVAAPSPASITVKRSPAAASRPSAETRQRAPTAVVRVDRGTIGGPVLEQAPAPVRVARPAGSDPPKLVEADAAESRTVQIVQLETERRVTRAGPELASIPVPRRSTGDSMDPMADFGWLSQAMHRRIAELKRYPHAARLNQWEGRVVLRAVIRDDGELAALSVRRSSGHRELDEEAMKLVQQVCPIPLTHALGRPEVILHIPITYALEH